MKKKNMIKLCTLFILTSFVLCACNTNHITQTQEPTQKPTQEITPPVITNTISNTTTESLSVTTFDGQPYITINNNIPYFTDEEKECTTSFEIYSDLDELNRCQVAYACIGKDIMPTEERESIGSIKPTGWHTVKYPDIISDLYLYNRCHLIAYCLTGENANEKNLITGTRYLNISGMLPFETMTCDYLDDHPTNHVLYRATPIFSGNNLVADGVLLEGYSLEDNGNGIEFCVFCYNIQPGITIDYTTGDSYVNTYDTQINNQTSSDTIPTFIINTNSNKIHQTNCSALDKTNEENKLETYETYEELIQKGYEPCGLCHPESK